MVLSIHMKKWQACEREVKREIMNTDVFVKVLSNRKTSMEMQEDVDAAFAQFRDFENRFSRFLPESELSRLNVSRERCVSMELFDILKKCEKYYMETDGIFDPSILSSLKKEGYRESYEGNAYKVSAHKVSAQGTGDHYTFSDVQLLPKKRLVRKPQKLLLDLGGIGKGYIVDRVAEKLAYTYDNVFVCAGGDIRAYGEDKKNRYAFWASDVENPMHQDEGVATVLLKDCAVATSGINRRRWRVNNQEKHHLIDPNTGESANTDVVSVTVVSGDAESADIWAKVLCILGSNEGLRRAEEKAIPGIFVEQNGSIQYTQYVKSYVWKKD